MSIERRYVEIRDWARLVRSGGEGLRGLTLRALCMVAKVAEA